MTIRSGGRPRDPRDRRQPHARPFVEDAYATEYEPIDFEPSRRDVVRGGRGYRSGGGGGSGFWGLVKFLVFILVLAAVVLGLATTVLRPVLNSAVLGWAMDNPGAWDIEFVNELVREELGDSLTEPASSDESMVEFVVREGDTASSIAARLEDQGVVTDARAFVFIADERELSTDLQQGTFILRASMTPDEVVTALLAPELVPFVDIALRTGLRLEQITAKLQTLALEMDPREFYELATEPPASLIADYPWLEAIRETAPETATLEGFLWPATYRVRPDTTPEELIRLMLDKFIATVGEERLAVPEERGLTFFEVLTLASIVEREAVLDAERALIAGVYQNRIDRIPGVKPGLLNADPTVIWAADTVALDELGFDEWQRYVFWTVPETALADLVLPEALVGYNTYTQAGLPPGPIATPTLASIDAALAPDTEEKYIYFLAIPEGDGAHVFARNLDEHNANREEYGYN
jgi:UPF0755 protein